MVREPFREQRPIYTPSDKLLAPFSDPYFAGSTRSSPTIGGLWNGSANMINRSRGDASAADAATHQPRSFRRFRQSDRRGKHGRSRMADNDYSLGLIVERIAHGKAANSTLIFVIEDDAQNGADHVDARRSLAFILGPYVRRGALVSTRYTTINVLRTIEALLALKPLGLNDGLASPMADVFDLKQQQWSYRAEAADALRSSRASNQRRPLRPGKVGRGLILRRSRCRLLGRGHERAGLQQGRPSRYRRFQRRSVAWPRCGRGADCSRWARPSLRSGGSGARHDPRLPARP